MILVYNHFESPLVQRVVEQEILPIPEHVLEASEDAPAALVGDFIYEPEPEQILERLLPVYVETELYRALLESAASEQGARMTAMRNASKNAGELIDSLTLAMNRARQAEITQEILEVVAGADALTAAAPPTKPAAAIRTSNRPRPSHARLCEPRDRSDGAARQGREVLSAGAGLAAEVALEERRRARRGPRFRARGYWEQVWLRFRRDKVAIAGGIFIILLVLVAFVGAPLAEQALGHGPNDIFPTPGVGVDMNLVPVGLDDVTTSAPRGAPGEGTTRSSSSAPTRQLGRDMFLRLLYGAQVSLEVAIGATLLVRLDRADPRRSIAGFFRGIADTVISRLTEIVMAFPLLLFVIAVAATVGEQTQRHHLRSSYHRGVVTLLILVGGIFGWFYPARIIRAQVLSLREKEFIEAARMTGASDWRIMRSHLLPHLVAPLIVFSTLIVATNVIAEAGLSFLGLGIPAPTASWGNLLAEGPNYYLSQPWLMVWPGLAILLTTLAFNLLGDGLRDAFDPRAPGRGQLSGLVKNISLAPTNIL